MTPPFPAKGVLIGVDYGTVRIGLSVCDPDRIVASALETITRKTPESDAAAFANAIAGTNGVGFVVGLPISLNDTEGPKALETRAFGDWLSATTGLPVAFTDERFTTAAAEDALRDAGVRWDKRKGKRDRIAAQMILQSYIEGVSGTS